MLRSLRFLAILACAMPLACADTSNTPTATTPPPVPSFSANPSSNGAILTRYDWGFTAMLDTDPRNGLAAMYSSAEAACLGTPTHLISVLQVIRRPEDQFMMLGLLKAPDLFIKVWQEPFDPCVTPPLAAGTGHVAASSSDVFMLGPNAAVVRLTAEATLYGPEGQPYHFTGVMLYKYQANAPNPEDRYLEVIRNQLQAMP